MPHFVDTNVVIYAFGQDSKAAQAMASLRNSFISVQVLNEFANVAIRKLGMNIDQLEVAISDIRSHVGSIAAIDEPTHDLARDILFRYNLSFYDSALVASALLMGCDTFFSEDMHNGLVIDGRLTIRNPFA